MFIQHAAVQHLLGGSHVGRGVATGSHCSVEVQPSKRAFPARPQRVPCGGSTLESYSSRFVGLLFLQSSPCLLCPSPFLLSPRLFKWMHLVCTLLSGDRMSANRMSDQVADEFSFADGWCSLAAYCSLSCKYQQTFLPEEWQTVHLISSGISRGTLEPQLPVGF